MVIGWSRVGTSSQPSPMKISETPARFAALRRARDRAAITLCGLAFFCALVGFFDPASAQGTKKGSETAEEYLEKGVAFLKEKRPQSAAEALKKATELDPNNWKAYYDLGLAYHFWSGRVDEKTKSRRKGTSRDELLDQAKASYLKSIELNDTNLKAYRNLGMIQVYRRDYKEAADTFKKGLDTCADTGPKKTVEQVEGYYKIAKAIEQHYISGIMGIDFGMPLADFRKEVKARDEADDRYHSYLTTVHFTVNSPDIDRNVVAWFLVDRAFSPLVGMFYSITRPSSQDPLTFLKLRYPREVALGARTVDMSSEHRATAEQDLIWRGDHTLALSRTQVVVEKVSKGTLAVGRILVAEVHKELAEVVEERMKSKGVATDILKYILDTSYEMGKDVLDYDLQQIKERLSGTGKTR